MKKTFVFILVIILLATPIALYFVGKKALNTGSLFSRYASLLFDYNKISVESNIDEITPKDIKIVQKGRSVVFEKGKKTNWFVNRYGMTCFVIYSKDIKISEVCFFKKNYWHINHYAFLINHFGEDVFVECEIIGPDSISNLTYKKYGYYKEYNILEYYDNEKNLYFIDTIH